MQKLFLNGKHERGNKETSMKGRKDSKAASIQADMMADNHNHNVIYSAKESSLMICKQRNGVVFYV
jgi:hypothetical protein